MSNKDEILKNIIEEELESLLQEEEQEEQEEQEEKPAPWSPQKIFSNWRFFFSFAKMCFREGARMPFPAEDAQCNKVSTVISTSNKNVKNLVLQSLLEIQNVYMGSGYVPIDNINEIFQDLRSNIRALYRDRSTRKAAKKSYILLWGKRNESKIFQARLKNTCDLYKCFNKFHDETVLKGEIKQKIKFYKYVASILKYEDIQSRAQEEGKIDYNEIFDFNLVYTEFYRPIPPKSYYKEDISKNYSKPYLSRQVMRAMIDAMAAEYNTEDDGVGDEWNSLNKELKLYKFIQLPEIIQADLENLQKPLDKFTDDTFNEKLFYRSNDDGKLWPKYFDILASQDFLNISPKKSRYPGSSREGPLSTIQEVKFKLNFWDPNDEALTMGMPIEDYIEVEKLLVRRPNSSNIQFYSEDDKTIMWRFNRMGALDARNRDRSQGDYKGQKNTIMALFTHKSSGKKILVEGEIDSGNRFEDFKRLASNVALGAHSEGNYLSEELFKKWLVKGVPGDSKSYYLKAPKIKVERFDKQRPQQKDFGAGIWTMWGLCADKPGRSGISVNFKERYTRHTEKTFQDPEGIRSFREGKGIVIRNWLSKINLKDFK